VRTALTNKAGENDTISEVKAISLQAWTGPEGSRRLRLPDFKARHMRMISLSALSTGRLYTPRNIPGTHFC